MPYYFTWVVLAITNLIGVAAGGAWPLLTLGLAFAVIPFVDAHIGPDVTRASVSAARDGIFKTNLYLYTGVQFSIFFLFLMSIAFRTVTWGDVILMSLSFGIMSGALGITVAHELMHKPNRLDQTLASALLCNVCYMHYIIEHLQGHHHRVATLRDPASARFGESFYEFLPRTLIESYRSAWRLERIRLAKRKKPLLSHHNKMLWYGLLPIGAALLFFVSIGFKGVVFFLLQSALAVTLLEVANYIEHYGLSRALIEKGRYEKVTAKHSWDANYKVSTGLLFGLQRHPDHHLHPLRPYQALEARPDSPQLPFGYPTMALMALVPGLWRAIMHPRIEAYQTRD